MNSDRYRSLYVSTLALSITLIAGSRVLGVWWFESVVSVAVLIWMLILGYLVYRKSAQDFDESDADYYYYYGFILTLVTLASTFLPFYFSPAEVKISRESIIGGFGLGLVTTFVGLTGRVLLYQQFERLASGAETAMQTIGIVSNKFAREVSVLTSSMTTNLDELSKSYRDSASTLQRATEELASDVVFVSEKIRGLGEVVEATRSGLGSAGEKLESLLLSDGSACASALSSVSEAGSALSNALALLQQQARAVELQELALQSRDVRDALTKLNGVFDSASESVGDGARALSENFDTVAKSVGLVEQRLGNMSTVIGDSSETFAAVAATYSSFSDSIGRSAGSVEAASGAVTRVSVAMKGGLEDALSLLKELAASFKPLAAEVNEFRVGLGKDRVALAEYDVGISDLSKSLSAAALAIEEMALRLEEGERRLGKVGVSGIGLVETSIEQLIGTFANVSGELNSLASQVGSASGEIAMLQERQAALWKAQEGVQNLVAETHKALLAALRSLRDEIR